MSFFLIKLSTVVEVNLTNTCKLRTKNKIILKIRFIKTKIQHIKISYLNKSVHF